MTNRFTDEITPMNREAQVYLEQIVAKNPEDLGQGEKDFLRARFFYLTGAEQAKFSRILLDHKDDAKPIEIVDTPFEGQVDPTVEPSVEVENKIPYRELQKLATKHKIHAVGVPYDELLVKVQEAENKSR